MVAVTTKWMLGREARRFEMRASLPTPLGPEMTRMRGLGLGRKGEEEKEVPMEDSRARRSSERLEFSREGMGTWEGLRASPIREEEEEEERLWVVELRIWNEKLLGFDLRSGGGREGRVREEFKILRIMVNNVMCN